MKNIRLTKLFVLIAAFLPTSPAISQNCYVCSLSDVANRCIYIGQTQIRAGFKNCQTFDTISLPTPTNPPANQPRYLCYLGNSCAGRTASKYDKDGIELADNSECSITSAL